MKFPEDYPVHALRGVRAPTRNQIRGLLLKRAAWLEKKAAQAAQLGQPSGFYLDELAALLIVVKEWEAAQAAGRSDGAKTVEDSAGTAQAEQGDQASDDPVGASGPSVLRVGQSNGDRRK